MNVTDNGEIRVRAKKSCVSTGKRTNIMCKKSENETVIIVGGGGAAQSCAETLRSRENPWKGRIVMMTKEDSLPYDRPKLSKVRDRLFGLIRSWFPYNKLPIRTL